MIEIAVVQPTVPTYGDGIGAHYVFNRGRIIGLNQGIHIILVIIGCDEVVQEPRNGQIGDGKKIVEVDVKILFKCMD